MVRATDGDAQPSIRRQTIVNRLDAGQDLTADRIGRMAVVAQEEHERSMDAFLNDAAERATVHIDPGLAPGIVVAELCGCRPTKGVAKRSHARQIEPARKPAGRVGALQPLQPIKYERDVGGPRSQQPAHTNGLLDLLPGRTELRVIL